MPKLRHTICNCVNCDTPFTIQTAKLERLGGGKYCSRACQTESTGYRLPILAAMPGTLQAICSRTGFTEYTVLRRIKSMRESSLCHISQVVRAPGDWAASKPDFTLCYDRGPGLLDDVPLDAREALTYFYRLMILASMPATQTKIIEITGLSQNSVFRMVRDIHAAGNCHIRSWKKSRGNQRLIAVFAAGKGKDAPKPVVAPMTSAERSRAHVARLRKNGKIVDYLAREAERMRHRRIRRDGDPLMNALYGAPAQRKSKQQPEEATHE